MAELSTKNSDEQDGLWSFLLCFFTPVWLFRCRPEEFSRHTPSEGSGGFSCPGHFWLSGLVGLLSLHALCFGGFFEFWVIWGWCADLLWFLAPVGIVWLILGGADLKFRLRKPSPEQRDGFDNATLNWFGMHCTIFFYVILVPTALLLVVWWLFW